MRTRSRLLYIGLALVGFGVVCLGVMTLERPQVRRSMPVWAVCLLDRYSPKKRGAPKICGTGLSREGGIDYDIWNYFLERGAIPTTTQGLGVIYGDYVPADIWGRPYQYISPHPTTPDDPNSYALISLGADGVPSIDDDRVDRRF